MKSVVLVLAGAADAAGVAPALAGRTPLAAARKPGLDALSRAGRVGAVRFASPGVHPGSERSLLALLGTDPDRHPLRRGPLEAQGAGFPVTPEDLVLAGSFVTLVDEQIVDLAAGRITTAEAQILLAAVRTAIGDEGVRIESLGRHRFTVIVPGGRGLELTTDPPHAARGHAARLVYPHGADAARFERILDAARDVLLEHDVNRVRVDLGENPANAVWLWGAGADRPVPPFTREYPMRAAAVAGAPLAKGVAHKLGFSPIHVPGAMGDLDTDLGGKAAAALAALEDHDLVFVHVQAIREAAHLDQPARMVEAIEAVDEKLVAPLAAGLARHERWRILVASDHGAVEDIGLAPFFVAGHGIQTVRDWPFDEAHAAQSDFKVDEGAKLIEWFLG